ncbi:MAG: alpha/beta hydrolase [Gemmiger sp.]
MLSLIGEMEALSCETVTVYARDGIKLSGRYYHVRDGAPLQIQFHGYKGNALRDFCGGNKLARESGQNTLLVDQRAHGKSGGTTITFGIRERLDCLCWVEYARQRFGSDTPIFLSGVSMGAATVLMASELELPANVVGIIADCPYSSPEAIIRKVCRQDMHLPPVLVMPFLRLGARLFGRFDLREASAVQAVRNTNIPILLLHGEDDRFVPCDMSREILAACQGSKTLVSFPGAGHGLSYLVDTDAYQKAVLRFVDQCLRTGRGTAPETKACLT